MAYDQLLVGSEVGRSVLGTTSAGRLDVLRNAADIELFAPARPTPRATAWPPWGCTSNAGGPSSR